MENKTVLFRKYGYEKGVRLGLHNPSYPKDGDSIPIIEILGDFHFYKDKLGKVILVPDSIFPDKEWKMFY